MAELHVCAFPSGTGPCDDNYVPQDGTTTNRGQYYNICGYPDVFFDGGTHVKQYYGGAGTNGICGAGSSVPAMITEYEDALTNASAIPGNVSIAQSATDWSGNVTDHASITSGVNGSFYAVTYLMETIGKRNVTNASGHQDVADVVRETLFNRTVNLTVGTTSEINASGMLNASWNAKNLTVVTFVQQNSTKVIENANLTPVSSQPRYEVVFSEKGLPKGVNWSVDLNGSTQRSSLRSLEFFEPNGTFNYYIGAVPGFALSRVNGTVLVSGSNRAVSVKFNSLPAVTAQQLSGTREILSLSSLGTVALSAVALPRGSFELVLANAKNNSSMVLGGVHGGGTISPEDLIASGGRFFLGVLHSSGSAQTFYQITKAGKVTKVSLPLGSSVPWLFPFGNSSALIASSTGYLVEIDPSTRAVVTNFSGAIPRGLSIYSALGLGSLLYIAGTLQGNGSSSSVYFGVLNASSGALSRISPLHYFPSTVTPEFLSIASDGKEIYVGGGTERSNTLTGAFGSWEGLLYRYTPSSGAFVNRSSLLANSSQVVWAMEPWSTGLLLNVEAFSTISGSTTEWGGLFSLGGTGGKLTNESFLLPSGFAADRDGITSESSGYVFIGGYNAFSGLAQLVVIEP